MIQKRRLFQDEAGREWAVFAVTPDAMFGGGVRLLPREYADGWLVFEANDERYRVVPVPAQWGSAPAETLYEMLTTAKRPAVHF